MLEQKDNLALFLGRHPGLADTIRRLRRTDIDFDEIWEDYIAVSETIRSLVGKPDGSTFGQADKRVTIQKHLRRINYMEMSRELEREILREVAEKAYWT